MRVTPLSDRVLLRVDENDTVTPSGLLHLPDTVKHNVTTGTVVAVGPGALRDGQRQPILKGDGSPLAEGDRVQFTKYGGSDVSGVLDGHLMVSEGEILGVIS